MGIIDFLGRSFQRIQKRSFLDLLAYGIVEGMVICPRGAVIQGVFLPLQCAVGMILRRVNGCIRWGLRD